jgi:hypothetical protein
MHIGELQRVQDLAEGERALPEHGTVYRLRSIDNTAVETHVEFVVRRDRLQRLERHGQQRTRRYSVTPNSSQ